MVEHWLIGVAKQAGLDTSALIFAPTEALATVWSAIVGETGVSAEDLAQHVAQRFRLPVADLNDISAAALALVPENAVRQFGVLPLRQNNREIHLATSDPTEIEVEQAIGFVSARSPQFEIAPPDALRAAIERHYGAVVAADPVLRAAARAGDGALELAAASPEAISSAVAGAKGGASSAVLKLADIILTEALTQRASRVRIGAVPSGGMVTFAVDGVMRGFMKLPVPAMNRVVNRFQVLGRQASERPGRHAGIVDARLAGQWYDVRVRVLPADRGNVVELRINAHGAAPCLEDLGVSGPQRAEVARLLLSRPGFIFVVAPQREGLTSLLYGLAREAAGHGIAPAIIVDEAEQTTDGAQQIVLDPERGLTGVRAIQNALAGGAQLLALERIWGSDALRAAYDAGADRVVLIGVPSATVDDACQRMLDVGLTRPGLAQRFRGALTQRLLRRPCPYCAQARAAVPGESRSGTDIGSDSPPAGCERCYHTGYLGVVPVIQILNAGDGLAEVLRSNPLPPVAQAAGARELVDIALERARAAETTEQEIERVFGNAEAAPEKLRVLVADDDPETRMLARAALQAGGYVVEDAEDGKQTLDRLRRGAEFALLVLDLDMPEIDGREVLRRLKSNVRTAGLPVVVLTGLADPGLEGALVEDGAADYIRKPIDPPQFAARVRAAIQRQTAELG